MNWSDAAIYVLWASFLFAAAPPLRAGLPPIRGWVVSVSARLSSAGTYQRR